MASDTDTRAQRTAARVRALQQARAEAELAQADALAPGSDRVAWRGSLMAGVAVVKGLPGPAEAAGGAAVSGADGEALAKALEALGWPADGAFYTLSRPEASLDAECIGSRLRLQIEAVDPQVVIALDAEAASDVATAFEMGSPPRPGSPVRAAGRRFVALSGFESALADATAKKRAWSQLKTAVPDGSVY